LFSINLNQDKAIHFEDLEFIANRPRQLESATREADSGAVVRGMARSGSPSPHAILEESSNEDDLASSEGESSGFPLLMVCNVVIYIIPIVTMSPPEETSMSQTIPARP
jgi:hypothetical protein